MSALISQLNITKRIIGCWLGKADRYKNVRITLVEVNNSATMWDYKLEAYGYTVLLTIYADGTVSARVMVFGALAAGCSTIAGFCDLINKCKRWSRETCK